MNEVIINNAQNKKVNLIRKGKYVTTPIIPV